MPQANICYKTVKGDLYRISCDADNNPVLAWLAGSVNKYFQCKYSDGWIALTYGNKIWASPDNKPGFALTKVFSPLLVSDTDHFVNVWIFWETLVVLTTRSICIAKIRQDGHISEESSDNYFHTFDKEIITVDVSHKWAMIHTADNKLYCVDCRRLQGRVPSVNNWSVLWQGNIREITDLPFPVEDIQSIRTSDTIVPMYDQSMVKLSCNPEFICAFLMTKFRQLYVFKTGGNQQPSFLKVPIPDDIFVKEHCDSRFITTDGRRGYFDLEKIHWESLQEPRNKFAGYALSSHSHLIKMIVSAEGKFTLESRGIRLQVLPDAIIHSVSKLSTAGKVKSDAFVIVTNEGRVFVLNSNFVDGLEKANTSNLSSVSIDKYLTEFEVFAHDPVEIEIVREKALKSARTITA